MSFGVVDELWIAGIITVRREVGPGVAVHELRDLLGAGDELDGLLLQRV